MTSFLLLSSPNLDTFHGHYGIKTQLADLFHPHKALSLSQQLPTVHEHPQMDSSRSANSPLTADIGFFQPAQAIKEKEESSQMPSGPDDVASVDGVANFHHDLAGSDSTSHVLLLLAPPPLTLTRTPMRSLILGPQRHLQNPSQLPNRLRNTLATLSRFLSLLMPLTPQLTPLSLRPPLNSIFSFAKEAKILI